MRYTAGDEVICKILYGEIVRGDANYYEFQQRFQIVSAGYEEGYLGLYQVAFIYLRACLLQTTTIFGMS